MMYNLQKLFLVFFTLCYLSHHICGSEIEATNDTEEDDREAILGEDVREMVYSDLRDLEEERNGSQSFDFVRENSIDDELEEAESNSSSFPSVVLIVIGLIAPFGIALTVICYLIIVCIEKREAEKERRQIETAEVS